MAKQQIAMVAGADYGMMIGIKETITISKTEKGFTILRHDVNHPDGIEWHHTGTDFTVCVYFDGEISGRTDHESGMSEE